MRHLIGGGLYSGATSVRRNTGGQELFKQLRNESPVQYLGILRVKCSNYVSRWRTKGLFSSIYSTTVTERKLLENTVRTIG